MKTMLPFLLPPLLGALIGYVTNALAIKMLFRPLEPVRLFGIKLPFTPGILPRQRHKLADNIGRTVERELLTEETIRKRLEQDDFYRVLYTSISQYTASILDKKLKNIASAYITKAVIVLHGFLHSATFSKNVHSFLSRIITSLSKKSLGHLLKLDRAAVKQGISNLLDNSMNSWKDQLDLLLKQRLDQAYPEFVTSIFHFLNQTNVRNLLESQGRIFLNNAILKLNVFQRFFISAGQYDRTLHEKIPEIIDDLLEQLKGLVLDEKNKGMLLDLARTNIINFFYKPENIDRLSGILSESLQKIFDDPISDLLVHIFGIDEQLAADKAAALVQESVQQKTPEKLEESILLFINANSDTSIAGLLYINQQTKQNMDTFICKYLVELIKNKIPEALNTLDVRTLVSERIDSLDMIDVEKIVLDVLANQLRWINVFGAFLGALIGLSQVFISMYLM